MHLSMLCSEEGLLNILMVVTSSSFLECLKGRRKVRYEADKCWTANSKLHCLIPSLPSLHVCGTHMRVGVCACCVGFIWGWIFSISVLTLFVKPTGPFAIVSSQKRRTFLNCNPCNSFIVAFWYPGNTSRLIWVRSCKLLNYYGMRGREGRRTECCLKD